MTCCSDVDRMIEHKKIAVKSLLDRLKHVTESFLTKSEHSIAIATKDLQTYSRTGL